MSSKLLIFRKNLIHNYRTLKSSLKKGTQFIAVIKANAYGSNSVEVCKELVLNGVECFAVASAKEGIELREAKISTPILVFYPQLRELEGCVTHKLEPVLYSEKSVSALEQILLLRKINSYPVHIKCNTGLNRLGFSFSGFQKFLTTRTNKVFQIKSVYSHLACSEEDKNHPFTQQQLMAFEKFKAFAIEKINPCPMFHVLNTSGVFNFPEHQMDAVRVGIGLYGFANRPEWNKVLKPIARLESVLCQIHKVNKGESVGYNQGWVAEKDSTIGVIPLGHADGIGRYFGKQKAYVWINDKQAPIIGNICMDMLMVNVSSINCEEGDTVVFFDDTHPATFLAKEGQTIVYELLAGLGKRIERKFV